MEIHIREVPGGLMVVMRPRIPMQEPNRTPLWLRETLEVGQRAGGAPFGKPILHRGATDGDGVAVPTALAGRRPGG